MPSIAELRERFSQDFSKNRIAPDDLWNTDCEGYNIQVLLKDLNGVDDFAKCQKQISVEEGGNLYQCPVSSLHISIAWIVAVQQNYSERPDRIWEKCKEKVIEQLKDQSRDLCKFSVRYTGLVATNSAVIAVGEDDGTISMMRERIRRNVDLPKETLNCSDIIHTTLFRYRNKLSFPENLLRRVNDFPLDISLEIDNVVIEKELVYPSIVSENLLYITLK